MVSSANRKGRRIVALWFARLPTDRVRRACPVPPDPSTRLPLVITLRSSNALRLCAVDRQAELLGLAAGMMLADARAMVPGLDVVAADEGEDQGLLARIADWCERYTPLVALDAPHGLLLDITGAAHLFGGEAAMLKDMCTHLEGQGFTVRGAIAGSAGAARALARGRDGAIVGPGEDAAAVALLPIETLDLDPLIQHALRRAGLKTIGMVAARQRGELAARFGADFIATLDHVLGRGEMPISPRRPLPACRSEYRFAEPVVRQEQVYATLQGLAARLGDVLEHQGEGVRSLEAYFFRSDGAVHRIAVETARPIRDHGSMIRLLRERLDALADPLDPGFGYDLIRLCAQRSEPLAPQPIAFDSRSGAEEEIAALIDRLGARFGAERIRIFQPADTHLPEKAAACLPAHRASCVSADWQLVRAAGEAPRRPLRMFSRSEPIEVTAQIPEGPPLQFRWRRVMHLVARAEGPERIAMAWWHDETPQATRDYYRVEDGEGRRFWLYRDGIYGEETPTPRWFVQGLFA